MNRFSPAEMLQLRELLQMETNSVAKAKATMSLIQDDELLTLAKSGIQATEARIKGMQKLISDHNLVSMEVH